MKAFNDSSQSLILLFYLLPNVVGNEGNIARKSLIDSLLDSNAGHKGIQMSFILGDIDKTDDDSSA
jgi:hypothetical protein